MSAEPRHHRVLDELLARTVGAGSMADLPALADEAGEAPGPDRDTGRRPRRRDGGAEPSSDASVSRGPLALALGRAATEQRLAASEARVAELTAELAERDARLRDAAKTLLQASEQAAHARQRAAALEARLDASQQAELEAGAECEHLQAEAQGLRAALLALSPLAEALGQAAADFNQALTRVRHGASGSDRPAPLAAVAPIASASSGRSGGRVRPTSGAAPMPDDGEPALVRALTDAVERWRSESSGT